MNKRPRGTGSIYLRGELWWLKYYKNGVMVREPSGTASQKQAEKLLQQRMGEVAAGTYIEPINRKITVDQLYQAFLDDYRVNGLASLEGAEQRWQRQPKEGESMPEPGRLKKYFGGWKALAVTTDKLNKYAAWCRELGLANATINRDFAALRRAFNLACRAGTIRDVPYFPHLKEAPPRDGFLEEAEYQKLTQHAPELWLRALLAGLHMGIRRGELTGDRRNGYQDALRVRHVDLSTRMIRLKETKNGDDRIVPMSQELYQLLTACVAGKQKNDFVFTRSNGEQVQDFRGRWQRLLKDAGVESKLVHDTRRTGVRNMERAGIPRAIAMKISGHRSESVYRRYAIVSEADLKEAVAKLEAAKRIWEVQAQFGHNTDDLHKKEADVDSEEVDLKPSKSVN